MQQHRILERRLAAVTCAGVVWISHADGAQPSAPPDVADGDFGRGAEAENQRQSPVPQGFPHLLKDIAVTEPDQAWRADIACIPLRRGFMHLVTVMDWATRFALSRRLSNRMGTEFCLEALDDALRGGRGGASSTRTKVPVHQRRLHGRRPVRRRDGVDGRGGALDGQPLHRTALAVAQVRGAPPARAGQRTGCRLVISSWMAFCNDGRPHSSLGGLRPRMACEGVPMPLPKAA